MTGRRLWLVAAGLTVLWAGGQATGQDSATVDPRAAKIVQVMSTILTEAEQFTVHTEQTSDELTLTGDLVELSYSVDLAARRPGEVHAVLHGDLNPQRYWIGGGQAAVLDVARWTYAVAPVPEDLDGAIEKMWSQFGIKIPLADFISNSPSAALMKNVKSGTYGGLREVDGRSCHHLIFRQDDIDWQIWIDDGLVPVPRKLLIVYKEEEGAPRYTATFTDWDLSPALGSSLFQFQPPDGAKRSSLAE